MNKICFFTGALSDGGAERVIVSLSKKFVEFGFEVEILTYYDREDFYQVDPRVKRLAVCSSTNSTNKLKNLVWTHKHFKGVDCVVSFLAPFNIFALLANSFNNTKIAVADRNDPKKVPSSSLMRLIRNLLYRFSDRIVLQTEQNKSYFSKRIRKKSAVIYNPVDTELLNGLQQVCERKNEIVSVGRLMPQKNQSLLIDAFCRFHKNHKNYSLKIFGEGPERGKLQKKIDGLKLNDCVFLMGNDKKVLERIRESSVFILTSDYEGMPNALIEAMCLGMICISTKVSGATELIVDGDNGFLVDCNEVLSLKNKIEYAVSLDEERKQTIREKASLLRDKLSLDNIAAEWEGLIKGLLVND